MAELSVAKSDLDTQQFEYSSIPQVQVRLHSHVLLSLMVLSFNDFDLNNLTLFFFNHLAIQSFCLYRFSSMILSFNDFDSLFL